MNTTVAAMDFFEELESEIEQVCFFFVLPIRTGLLTALVFEFHLLRSPCSMVFEDLSWKNTDAGGAFHGWKLR